MIYGNAVGGIVGYGKTFILTDENGNELTAVCVDKETVFTATDNDVREGMIYASDGGVSTGTKDIPAYRTTAGIQMIYPGSIFSIPLSDHNKYDYTVFQCTISLANLGDMNSSVETSMISIKDGVYEVNSTTTLATISKNSDTKSIDLNITNDSENYYLIHYFTYRMEE